MEALMLNLININAPIPGPETVCFFWPASAFLSALDSHKYLVLDRDFMTTLTAWDPLRAEGDISCWLLPRTVSMGMYLMWFMASLHICFSGATRRPWGTFMEGVQPLQPLFRLFQNLLLKFQLHFPSHLLLHAFPIHGLTKSQDHLINLLLALANMASMQVDKGEAGWGGIGDCGAYFQSLLNLCLQAEFL